MGLCGFNKTRREALEAQAKAAAAPVTPAQGSAPVNDQTSNQGPATPAQGSAESKKKRGRPAKAAAAPV